MMARVRRMVLTWSVLPLLAAAMAPAILMGQAAAPGVDAATMTALLNAQPGVYTATGGAVKPADPKAGVPLFVQADAYRRTDGSVQVPVAVGATVSEPWVIHLHVTNAGDGKNAVPDVTLTGDPGAVRQFRELELKPGRYNIDAVLARRTGATWAGTVVKQPLTVPDLSGGQLVLSPVVLGDGVTPGKIEETERPFVFGPTNLTTAVTNLFKQSAEMHYAVRIYGWKGDAEAKPDLAVEYVFYQQVGKVSRFFTKTKMQSLNAKTVNKSFDGLRGGISTGMSIPLVNFPPGEFELTARVRDVRVAGPAPQSRGAQIGGSRARGSRGRSGAPAQDVVVRGPGLAEQKVRFFVSES